MCAPGLGVMTDVNQHVMKGQLGGVFIGAYHIVSAQSPSGFLEINVKFINNNDIGQDIFENPAKTKNPRGST